MKLATAARYVDLLREERLITAPARRRAIKLIERRREQARRAARTLSARIVRRLAIPATPTEIAALFRLNLNTARTVLYQLKDQGRVRRLERRIINPATGYPEFLWQRVFQSTKGA